MGVYVHLPWCVRKCPYCDFNSHVARGTLPQQQYLAALERDLRSSAASLAGRQVSTIFIGGGTPSLFTGQSIGAILNALAQQLDVASDAEVTLEANPGTAEAGRFHQFREAGVNRLSLGAQSFADPFLKALGRIHNAAEIETALRMAREAGFTSINLDLMYGLPDQTVEQALADVAKALDLGVPHLSHYQLTLEPDTHFYRFPPQLPDDDKLAAMEEACRARLRAAGLARYEVSAYARPGFQSRHNLNYWRFGDYLGLGAGAHSKLTLAGLPTRIVRRPNPASYMRHAGSADAISECRELAREDLVFEFMLNRLRLTAPLGALEFERATGLPFADVQEILRRLEQEKLMEFASDGWGPTPRGRDLLNEVIGRFLPE
jgi:oxygen-independent coproporphyrinogen-3 oxidase